MYNANKCINRSDWWAFYLVSPFNSSAAYPREGDRGKERSTRDDGNRREYCCDELAITILILIFCICHVSID